MNTQWKFMERHGTRIVAVLIVAVTYAVATLPEPTSAERNALASRFSFASRPLPEVAPQWPGHEPRHVREVHPSYRHIAGWISVVGAGVALNDLDGDGLPNDLCHVDPRTDLIVIAPVPGTPQRYQPLILSPAPLPYEAATTAPMGCLPGDLNEDGRMDVLAYYWGRTPIAFLRHGAGFVPREVMPGRERWFTNAATLADLDGDGHTDLVIGNYFPDGARVLDAHAPERQTMQTSMSRATNGGSKRLLLWTGATAGADPSVQYRDIDGVFNPEVRHGWTLAAAASDLDGDLLPELYFANDFGHDRLLHNRSTPGQLRFEILHGPSSFTTPTSSVLGRDSFKGMGVDFADLNGDAMPDIYVSNIAAPYALLESHFLFLSTGDPQRMKEGLAPYVNRSESLGLSRSGWGWDAKLADFDNDGVLEAMQATGFRKGRVNRWPELQELAISNDRGVPNPSHWPHFGPDDDLSGSDLNPFFVRAANGKFVDVAGELGLDQPHVSRGIAIADVDGDGGLDFAVANQWEASYFYRNQATGRGAFLGLHLLLPLDRQGADRTTIRPGHPGVDLPGRPAIGATATVYLPDGKRLAGQIDGGNGHSGKRSQNLHFGLGRDYRTGQVLKVELRWRAPDGKIQHQTLHLPAGWHTVQLGWPGE